MIAARPLVIYWFGHLASKMKLFMMVEREYHEECGSHDVTAVCPDRLPAAMMRCSGLAVYVHVYDLSICM